MPLEISMCLAKESWVVDLLACASYADKRVKAEVDLRSTGVSPPFES